LPWQDINVLISYVKLNKLSPYKEVPYCVQSQFPLNMNNFTHTAISYTYLESTPWPEGPKDNKISDARYWQASLGLLSHWDTSDGWIRTPNVRSCRCIWISTGVSLKMDYNIPGVHRKLVPTWIQCECHIKSTQQF
jgi:hypothetical protein